MDGKRAGRFVGGEGSESESCQSTTRGRDATDVQTLCEGFIDTHNESVHGGLLPIY